MPIYVIPTPQNLLAAADALADTVVRGDVLYGNSTPKWARLAKPSVLSGLSHDGTDVSWVTATGTGAPVRATSPVLVTPTLGAALFASLYKTSAVYIGLDTGAIYPGIWLGANAANPTTANYAFLSDPSGIGANFNTPSADLSFRIANANYIVINTSRILLAPLTSGLVEQRDGANAQTFRLYETYTNSSNYSRLSVSAPAGGPYTIKGEAAGTGVARNLLIPIGTNVTIGNQLTTGGPIITTVIHYRNGAMIDSVSGGDTLMLINDAYNNFGRLQFGGTTSSFPALKRSTTILQGRLADDSAFCTVQGILKTDANATTGLTAGVLAALTNASITITDASGQVYRVPCII